MMTSAPDKALASQAQLNQLADKMGGRIPVRIYFLNNSSKVFLARQDTKVKELVRMVVEKLELRDGDSIAAYFALYQSLNGSSLDGICPMESHIADVITSWEGNRNAKMVFMIRLFLKSILGLETKEVTARRLDRDAKAILFEDYLSRAHVYDPNCLVLQHMQAVYNVITGKYPVSEEDALRLGAIHFLFKFHRYNPDQHVVGFLGNRIVEFIPITMIRAKRKDIWERMLYDELSGVYIPPGKDAMRMYLEEVLRMENLFGCEYYLCRQTSLKTLPNEVFVGINSYGITLFSKRKEFLRKYRLEGIFRWGYRPAHSFYFEVKSSEDAGSILEFETKEGEVISKLLTDYALGYLAERERDELRAIAPLDRSGDDESDEGGLDAEALQGAETVQMPTAAEAARKIEEVKELEDIADSSFVFRGKDKRDEAATKIQACYRGFALRSALIRHEAAIIVQAAVRGFLVRSWLDDGDY